MNKIITYINSPRELELRDIVDLFEDIKANPQCNGTMVEIDSEPIFVVYNGSWNKEELTEAVREELKV